MRRLLTPTSTGLAAVLAAASLLTACGGSDSDDTGAPAKSGAPEKTTLTVGVLPLADLAPFYLAIQDGLFKQEGLTVKAKLAPGGSAHVAAMVAGDIDIAFSNYVSILQAAEKGLPLRIVRENNRAGPQGIYAMKDSGIDKPGDLAGKEIAINTLGNIQELTARAVLESHGVDPKSLKFLEVPPPEALTTLEKGHVDAAWLPEPFIALAKKAGGIRRVVGAFEGPTENLPVAGWSATEKFVQENPNTIAAFVRAMDKAMRKAVEQPESLERVIPTFTSIKPALAAKLAKPGLVEHSDLSDLGALQDLMIKHGIADKRVDVQSVVVSEDELPGR